MKNDPRSCDHNFYNCVKKPEKKNSGLQRAPLKSWIFFRLLCAIAKIAITTARIILHLISYLQFTYDLFHMHHSLKRVTSTSVNVWLLRMLFRSASMKAVTIFCDNADVLVTFAVSDHVVQSSTSDIQNEATWFKFSLFLTFQCTISSPARCFFVPCDR